MMEMSFYMYLREGWERMKAVRKKRGCAGGGAGEGCTGIMWECKVLMKI
jgi:hypothetical protein